MKPTIFKSIQIDRYFIQTKMHQGKKHLVVPVIMMVEGVHHGSHGPVFHSAEELGKFPESWNGIPVVIQHPERDGNHVSANSPDVIDDEKVGVIFNAKFEDGKLKAEVWLNEETLEAVSQDTINYIKQGRALDVSVGVFTDDEQTPGEWNGEHYAAVSRNHRPDHLALLPGETGACSWADGCGIRNNKKGGNTMPDPNYLEELQAFKKEFYVKQIETNKLGNVVLTDLVRNTVDSMDTETKIYFLEEVYSNNFVYRCREVGLNQMGNTAKLYKQNYIIDSNNNMTLQDGPVEVTKKVTYTVSTNKMIRRTKTMVDNTEACCPKKVESLIQSNVSTFTEDDREWLSALTEDRIDKMIQADVDLETANTEIETNKVAKEKADLETNKEVTKKEAIEVLKEDFADSDKFLKLVPASIAEQLKHGLSLHAANRESLITNISGASEVYSKEDLEKMDITDLEKLSKFVKPQTNYVGQGGQTQIETNTNQEEVMLPADVKIKE